MSVGRSLSRSHLEGCCWCLAGPVAWPRFRPGPQRRSRAPLRVTPVRVSVRGCRRSLGSRVGGGCASGGERAQVLVLGAASSASSRWWLAACRGGPSRAGEAQGLSVRRGVPGVQGKPAPGCSASVFSGASTSCRLLAFGCSPPGCSLRCLLALRRVLGSALGASRRLGAHGDVRGASTSARCSVFGGAPSRCSPRWLLACRRVFVPG